MKIIYTITKSLAWKHYWRNWILYPLRLAIRLFPLPAITCGLSYLAGLNIFIVSLALLATGVLPFIILLLLVKRNFPNVSAIEEATAEQWIAEIGKFDFRLGPLSAPIYYHWSRFTSIEEADDCFYLLMRSHRPLWVPKKAFVDSASFDGFLAEALVCWGAAQLRQNQMVVPQDETVWPPAPRVGSSSAENDAQNVWPPSPKI